MTEQPQIRFEDGAAYENFMGVWSRSAGETFLDWLAPGKGLHWIDVGCGNGAFTELVVERTAPQRVLGVDPSDAQLDYARGRPKARRAQFVKGDAMALPAGAKEFDAAVMALVIFFVPEPAKGVAEMARVVKPGGSISAYAWDLEGGGFPFRLMQEELSAMGMPTPMPPNPQASRFEVLEQLWRGAGIGNIETRTIPVERIYADFDAMWAVNLSGPRLAAASAQMTEEQRQTLKSRLRSRVSPDPQGRITASARAHAIKGRLPA